MAGGNDRSPRDRARTWLALASLLVVLSCATVWLAVSGAAGRPAGGVRGVEPDAAAAPFGKEAAASRLDPASVAAEQAKPARSAGATAAGATTRGAMRDDAQGALVVRVCAAETGEAIGGADVAVTPRGGSAQLFRTDGMGVVRVALPADATCDVDVKAPGRVRERRSVAASSRGRSTETFRLERGVVIHGVVSDDRHRLRDAHVRAVALDALRASIPCGPDPSPIETTTTARDGSYRLDCVPRGLACVLIADADGHAAERVAIEPQPDPDYGVREDLVLARAIAFRGTVKNAEGGPVRGASVFVFPDTGTESGTVAWLSGTRGDELELALLSAVRAASTAEGTEELLDLHRALTDDDGAFVCALPARASAALAIALHDRLGRSAPTFEARPEAARPVILLRGMVRSDFEVLTESGQPAERVTISPHFPWERWTAPPHAPGRYGIADTPDGPILVDVEGTAGAPGTYRGERTASDDVRWRVQLQDGVTWRGVVTDDADKVVRGAMLAAESRTATSDEHGRFEIVGVHPATTWLVASAPGHRRATVAVDRSACEHLAVQLDRTATVRMKLVLPRDAPVPTWYRLWTASSSSTPVSSPWEDRFQWNDGDVEVGGWGPGDDTFFVFVPGYARVVREANAEPGTTLDLGRVALEPQMPIAVIVVDEDGLAVPHAHVDVRLVGDAPWIDAVPTRGADTNAEGRTTIGLAGGLWSYELTASAPGFMTTPQTAAPTASLPMTIVLGRGRAFAGRWIPVTWREARARLLGPADVEYAVVRVESDGSFGAEVPLRPHKVQIVEAFAAKPRVLAEAAVPADLAPDAVLEIR